MAWVWAKRNGTANYTGFNQRGASVTMARDDVEGAFTPGELLGVALAGCAGLSADSALSRRLGPDASATISIERTKHDVEDRYAELSETFAVALSSLDEAEQANLIQVMTRAIERACTVGLTLKAGADVTLDVIDG